MGGLGSGGNGRLTDAEKKARGTFRADQSDAVYDAQRAATVVVGPWLASIPEPTIPLTAVGRAKYDELTKLLFDGNKLTKVTCSDCERMAVMHQQMHERLTAGKSVPMELIKRMDSISVRLRIAEDAAPLASPGAKNKFASIGTAATVVSAYRLQRPAATGTGEH